MAKKNFEKLDKIFNKRTAINPVDLKKPKKSDSFEWQQLVQDVILLNNIPTEASDRLVLKLFGEALTDYQLQDALYYSKFCAKFAEYKKPRTRYQSNNTTSELKRVATYMPSEMQIKLKVVAAENKKEVYGIIIEAIEDYFIKINV